MEDQTPEKPDFLKTILAIVIAVITVFSAVISWQATLLEHDRVEADLDGLLASVNVQETLALNHIAAYDDLTSYTRYWQYTRLAESLADELPKADQQQAPQLNTELRRYLNLVLANKVLFPNRYLRADGRYELDHQLGEMWADAVQEKDLDPADHFQESNHLISRMLNMLAAGAILSGGLIFFTLVDSVGTKIRSSRLLLGLGSLLAVAGLVLALFTQLDLV